MMGNNSVDRITVLGRGEVILTHKEAEKLRGGGMDKVVLTAEQEKAINEMLFGDCWTVYQISYQHPRGWEEPSRACLNKLSENDMKRVLFEPNSYVVIDETTTIKNEQHLNHPFYKKVDEITAKVAQGQILKGAAKYDEPFDPDSWTGEELGNHALEELRDGQVYVVGMVEKIKGLEQENGYLKERLNNQNEDMYIHLRHEIKELKMRLEELMAENERLKEEANYREIGFNDITAKAEEYNKALKEENERLKEDRDKANESIFKMGKVMGEKALEWQNEKASMLDEIGSLKFKLNIHDK